MGLVSYYSGADKNYLWKKNTICLLYIYEKQQKTYEHFKQ